MNWNYDVNTRGNVQLSKDLNTLSVLNAIRNSSSISRSDVARITGLTTPTISNLVSDLIKEGFVIEMGPGESSVGRRPIMLEFNKDARYIGVIDFGRSNVIIGLTNLAGEIITLRELDLDKEAKPEITLERIGNELKNLIDEYEQNGIKVWGVGVAISGGVNGKTGVCIESYVLKWTNVPVRQILEAKVQCPVYVANNIRCMALGEKWFGAARDEENFLAIRFGRGVGSGIIINGELFEGVRGVAGEIGHVTVEPNGPECYCGNKGCLEYYISEGSIFERLEKLMEEGDKNAERLLQESKDKPRGKKLGLIARSAEEGDELSRLIIDDLVHYLGLAIANLVKAFNPSIVILLTEDKFVRESVSREIQAVVDPLLEPIVSSRVNIVPGLLGSENEIIGASTLVLDNVFKTIRIVPVRI